MTSADLSEQIYNIRKLVESVDHIAGGISCGMRDRNGRLLAHNHLDPLSSHLAEGCRDLEELAFELLDFQRELNDLNC